MSISVARMPVSGPASVLSGEQLAGLARTYDASSTPVWVHDLSRQCLYRNRMAAGLSVDDHGVHRFDIVDHRGRTVARLSTAAH